MTGGGWSNPERETDVGPTDGRLIERCLGGDSQAWAKLYFRYRTPLYGLCFSWTHDHALTEDIVHDSFVRAFERMRSFDQERRFFPWLATIARNRMRDIKNGFRADISLAESTLDPPLSRAVDSTLEAILEAENRDYVRAALAALPENQRLALVLSEVHELSYAQVAVVLGASVSAVKSLIFRARAVLKRSLRPLSALLGLRTIRARLSETLRRTTTIAARLPVETGLAEAFGVSLILAAAAIFPIAHAPPISMIRYESGATGGTITSHKANAYPIQSVHATAVHRDAPQHQPPVVRTVMTTGDTRPRTAAPQSGNLHLVIALGDRDISGSDTGYRCDGQGADLLPRSGPVRAAC